MLIATGVAIVSAIASVIYAHAKGRKLDVMAWASLALVLVLGADVIAVAMTGNMTLYVFYISVIAIGAKIAAFIVQYVVFRVIIRRRLAGRAATACTTQSLALL